MVYIDYPAVFVMLHHRFWANTCDLGGRISSSYAIGGLRHYVLKQCQGEKSVGEVPTYENRFKTSLHTAWWGYFEQ